MKKIYTVFRNKKSGKSAIGKLNSDGIYMCDTLELPWKDNQRNTSCIPCGIYPLKLTYSVKYKRDMPEIMNVPGRDGVRIHSANYPEELLGCIAVGENTAPDFIANSRATFARFMADFMLAIESGKETFIEIKEE